LLINIFLAAPLFCQNIYDKINQLSSQINTLTSSNVYEAVKVFIISKEETIELYFDPKNQLISNNEIFNCFDLSALFYEEIIEKLISQQKLNIHQSLFNAYPTQEFVSRKTAKKLNLIDFLMQNHGINLPSFDETLKQYFNDSDGLNSTLGFIKNCQLNETADFKYSFNLLNYCILLNTVCENFEQINSFFKQNFKFNSTFINFNNSYTLNDLWGKKLNYYTDTPSVGYFYSTINDLKLLVKDKLVNKANNNFYLHTPFKDYYLVGGWNYYQPSGIYFSIGEIENQLLTLAFDTSYQYGIIIISKSNIPNFHLALNFLNSKHQILHTNTKNNQELKAGEYVSNNGDMISVVKEKSCLYLFYQGFNKIKLYESHNNSYYSEIPNLTIAQNNHPDTTFTLYDGKEKMVFFKIR